MSASTPSGRPWALPIAVGVVGLALIGVGQTVANRHSIEENLMNRSVDALDAAGLTRMTADFSGRDAIVSGTGTAAEFERAVTVVRSVDGVRVASAVFSSAGIEPDPAGATAPATPDPAEPPSATTAPESPFVPVGFTLVDQTITVTGTVSAKAEQTALIAATEATGKDWKVVDRLTVDDTLKAISPAPSRFPAVTDLLATAPLDGTKLVIQYQPDQVLLRGTPSTAALEKSLLTAAAPTVAADMAVFDGLDVPAS